MTVGGVGVWLVALSVVVVVVVVCDAMCGCVDLSCWLGKTSVRWTKNPPFLLTQC